MGLLLLIGVVVNNGIVMIEHINQYRRRGMERTAAMLRGDITIGGHWNSREADEPVLEGRLSSKRDLSESYDLLERKIIRPLERIPGVGAVRLDGLNPKEVRINLRVEDLVYEEPPLEYGRHLDGNFAVGVTITAEAGANAVRGPARGCGALRLPPPALHDHHRGGMQAAPHRRIARKGPRASR